MLEISRQGLVAFVLLAASAALAGCAAQSGGRQPVGFTDGSDCHSVKAELHKLDGMGVPNMIQAQQAGQHVSADSKSKIDRYNFLLEEYLGNDCQLPPA